MQFKGMNSKKNVIAFLMLPQFVYDFYFNIVAELTFTIEWFPSAMDQPIIFSNNQVASPPSILRICIIAGFSTIIKI